MLESFHFTIQGVPYGQDKATGRVEAAQDWTAAVKAQTASLPKVKGACLMRVTFRLPPDKFPLDHRFGNDLDNLLKRLFDALNETVFSDAPGNDGCVVSLEATKTGVKSKEESGAYLEIVLLHGV